MYIFLIHLQNNLKMTIKEAQLKIDGWINSTGVRYFNELTNMAILMEEVGGEPGSFHGNMGNNH